MTVINYEHHDTTILVAIYNGTHEDVEINTAAFESYLLSIGVTDITEYWMQALINNEIAMLDMYSYMTEAVAA